MSSWNERIKSHRIWGEMEALGPALDNAANVADITPDALAATERVRAILEFIGKRLASADPILIPPNILDEIAALFTNSRTEVEAFVSNKNVGHLQNANSHTERAVTVSAQIPTLRSSEELQSLIFAINEYRDLFDQKIELQQSTLKIFNTERSALDNRINGLEHDIQVEREKLLKLTTEYQSQFSLAQDTRSREFTEAQGTRQTEHGKLLSEFERELTNQDSEFAKKRDDLFKSNESIIKGFEIDFKAHAEAMKKEIEDHKYAVEKLVGVIGNLGVTSGYLKTANRSYLSMWIWQFLTVGSLGWLSFLAYRTLPLLEDAIGRFNWGLFAGRVLLLMSLGVIAAYSGSQADKLFADEKRNRKLALELEAIGPYLSSLPKEEQDKFKIQIGDRTFGRELDAVLVSAKKSPVNLLDLAKSKETREFIELVVEIAKKVK